MNEPRISNLDKAKRGDIAAFESLLHSNGQLVYGIAIRMLGNGEDAVDTMREVFLRAFRNLQNFKDSAHLLKWLCRVTNNLCIDELRRRRNVLGYAHTDAEEVPYGDAHPPHIPDEQHRELESAISGLASGYKLMVILRDIYQISYEDIAEITRTSTAAVRSRTAKARGLLLEALPGDDAENDVIQLVIQDGTEHDEHRTHIEDISIYVDGETPDNHTFEKKVKNDPKLAKALGDYTRLLQNLRLLPPPTLPDGLHASIMLTINEEARPLEIIKKRRTDIQGKRSAAYTLRHLSKIRSAIIVFVFCAIVVSGLAAVLDAVTQPGGVVHSGIEVDAFLLGGGIAPDDGGEFFATSYDIVLELGNAIETEALLLGLASLGGYTAAYAFYGGGGPSAEITRTIPRGELASFLTMMRELAAITSAQGARHRITYELRYGEAALQELETQHEALSEAQEGATARQLQESALEIYALRQQVAHYLHLAESITLNITLVEQTAAPGAETFLARLQSALSNSNSFAIQTVQLFVVAVVWILPIAAYVGVPLLITGILVRREQNKK